MDAKPPDCLLVDLRILEDGVDSLAAAALEDSARFRARELETHADDTVRPLALRRGDPKRRRAAR